ncbi:MAG TPA: type II toxin-antitoxin system VapC family toxin [Candidatus Limnocylindrales bacterium]|nr:type II toxin-antitoxin system VapC family toxin [Candidatus Limnocylindrales bacterium]
MIVLDTTILAYAVGTEHPLRAPCRRLLTAHGEGHIEATTTIEVIQEFAHIRARRRTRTDAVTLARRYLSAFTVLVTTADDLDRGLTLFQHHPALGAFDAVLAAVALERRAEALVSADRAFASIPDLRWVDPATPALRSLIAG